MDSIYFQRNYVLVTLCHRPWISVSKGHRCFLPKVSSWQYVIIFLENRGIIFFIVTSSWLNHIMHTNIMIFIILELFTSFRVYPSRKSGLIGLALFMAAYLGWLHVIKYKTNIWVYPILEVLALPQRLIFFALSLVFSIGLYIFGEFFNEQIWVKEIKQATKHESKKVH